MVDLVYLITRTGVRDAGFPVELPLLEGLCQFVQKWESTFAAQDEIVLSNYSDIMTEMQTIPKTPICLTIDGVNVGEIERNYVIPLSALRSADHDVRVKCVEAIPSVIRLEVLQIWL